MSENGTGGRYDTLDEPTLRARHRRAFARQTAIIVVCISSFCVLISMLIGAPQSFLGEWWMKPPRYPGAPEIKFAEGEVCLMPAPGVYCYEWYYRTNDPVDEIIAHYEGLDWTLHRQISFEWRRGRRFDTSWVAEDCIRILSNVSCYQIIVHPSSDGDTEVYILERGAMGEIRAGDR